MSDLNISSFDPSVTKQKIGKVNVPYIQDANLQIHVPRTEEAGGLDNKHSFSSVLKGFLGDVNTLQHDADAQIQRFVAGETEDIHQVTMAIEEAKMSFDLMMSIKGQLQSAYDRVMSMR